MIHLAAYFIFMTGMVAGVDPLIELPPLMFIEAGMVAGDVLIELPLSLVESIESALLCWQPTITNNNAMPKYGTTFLRMGH